jgi:hypothetical protein
MESRVIKCSNFLIEQEFFRINKKIIKLNENLGNFDLSKGSVRNQKREVIDNTVKSLEFINKMTDEKRKELSDSLRMKKLSSQSEEEMNEIESKESEVLDDIDLEGEKKAADIVWEILPKKGDTKEVRAEKIDTTYSIFDHLTKNAKKFLLVSCVTLLGWNVAYNLFSQKDDAKNILDGVQKAGVSSSRKNVTMTPEPVFKLGELGAGGSIGETPEYKEKDSEKESEKKPEKISSELNKKLEIEKKNLLKKNLKIVDPSTLKVSDFFDRSKTVFTSPTFPYKINNRANIDEYFEDDRREDIKKKYIPTLDAVGKSDKMGLKLLALVMTYMEGYRKGTTSYVTNNPGNVDNTDSGKKNYIKTLDKGVKLQLDLLKDIANGREPNYPIGGIVSRAPYWSPDPNLKKWIPGMLFVYEGTLEQFLRVYATGCRNDNNYLNVILSFFEFYFPGKVTKETKIKDIINLGDTGKISVFIQKNKKEKEKEKEKKLLADK